MYSECACFNTRFYVSNKSGSRHHRAVFRECLRPKCCPSTFWDEILVFWRSTDTKFLSCIFIASIDAYWASSHEIALCMLEHPTGNQVECTGNGQFRLALSSARRAHTAEARNSVTILWRRQKHCGRCAAEVELPEGLRRTIAVDMWWPLSLEAQMTTFICDSRLYYQLPSCMWNFVFVKSAILASGDTLAVATCISSWSLPAPCVWSDVTNSCQVSETLGYITLLSFLWEEDVALMCICCVPIKIALSSTSLKSGKLLLQHATQWIVRISRTQIS